MRYYINNNRFSICLCVICWMVRKAFLNIWIIPDDKLNGYKNLSNGLKVLGRS